MKGVKFNDIHSYKDLNLVLAPFQMPPAKPKTNFIDVPGADGSIDASESLGEIKFNDRTGNFVFSVLPEDDFEKKKTEVSNLLNGLKCKIILDKDPKFYYLGRLMVNDYKANKMLRQITVEFRVQPYKFKLHETVVHVPFCEKNLLPDTVYDLANWGFATGTVNNYIFSLNLLDDGLYTINGQVKDNSEGYFYIQISGDGFVTIKETLRIHVPGSTTFPFTFEKKQGLEYRLFWYDGKNVVSDFVEKLQLEVGDTATEYEPFTPITLNELVLTNNRMSVVPIITTTEETTITFGGSQYVVNAGTHKILDFQLKQGETPVTISGEGITTITYQEGAL